MHPKNHQIFFSLKGRSCIGRWYRKNYRISIFINQIWSLIVEKYQDQYHERLLMAFIFAAEFHEIVHIKINQWGLQGQPCTTLKCEKGSCFWCNYMYSTMSFFMERDEEQSHRKVNFRYEY